MSRTARIQAARITAAREALARDLAPLYEAGAEMTPARERRIEAHCLRILSAARMARQAGVLAELR